MAISRQVREALAGQSWIRQMFEVGVALKRELGEERVFDLSLGNPALEPPEEFHRRLRGLAEACPPGLHRYMPNAGLPEVREAVGAQLARERGLPFTGQEVVMTCGAGGALNIILKALLDPGDEVVVFRPFFPEYPFYIRNHGGVPVFAPTDDAFLPDLEALERLLTPRTKAVLINSPNNPTGVLYPAGLLKGLGEVLSRGEARSGTTIYLVSDEPYASLVYDGLRAPCVFHYHPATVVATSFSKSLSLPGERIGYVAVSPHVPEKRGLVDALIFANRVLGFVNAPALVQHLLPSLLGARVDVGWYQERRDLVYEGLTAMGYRMVKPQGAFYAFPRSPIPDDLAFVQRLQRWNVLVAPGSGFGAPGYFRIAFCAEERVVRGAMEGFRRAIQA